VTVMKAVTAVLGICLALAFGQIVEQPISFDSGGEVYRHTAEANAGAAAFPQIVPSSVLGKGGATAPSNRVTLGVIGLGIQGKGNMRAFRGNSGDVYQASGASPGSGHADPEPVRGA